MLDIEKRIKTIEGLVEQNTDASLTYAALECRLTLEYLCYERFNFYHDYLSEKDLKKWQPRDVVKQISEEIDEFVSKGFTLSIAVCDKSKKIEDLDYEFLGKQSELPLRNLHKLWNGLSNVALHISIPSKDSTMSVYGEADTIRQKIYDVLNLLKSFDGNLFMFGPREQVFTFECVSCSMPIKRPVSKITEAGVVANCINPECDESYLLIPTQEDAADFNIVRRIFKFQCEGCKEAIEVPSNYFEGLRFNQELNVNCQCGFQTTVIMRPLAKNENSL
jgi:hypothetical protein